MKIERILSCFDKKDNELKWEINLDHIGLETLKSILKPKKDKYLHLIYTIDKSNYILFKELLNIEFDLESYLYEVGCYKV